MLGLLMHILFSFAMTFLVTGITIIAGYMPLHSYETIPNMTIISMIFMLIVWLVWLQRNIQAERIAKLYQIAKFQTLNSGVFHDLINPLTAITLSIEKLQRTSSTNEYINKALLATTKLGHLITSARKQLIHQENKVLFSINQEIKDVIDILSCKARQANVYITFYQDKNITLWGDAAKFSQIALNIITNAIDAYDQVQHVGKKRVLINVHQKDREIIFAVRDFGIGISAKHISHIFEPFFTTKAQGQGIGIGLSITKDIVQKKFKGTINVESKPSSGTLFTVTIPY